VSLELWNVGEDTECLAGAQSIFNIVGRVTSFSLGQRLTYSLNGGPERAVAVQGPVDAKRLSRFGDFNIDTITVDELRQTNVLRLVLHGAGGGLTEIIRTFRVRFIEPAQLSWRLDLRGASQPQEKAQIVDGKWRLGRDLDGRGYLAIASEDAGYDRVLLVGHRDWGSGYQVHARFRVDRWMPSISQGIGCAFHWNAHRGGDGSALPDEWSSGIAWAFSESPGLTIRVGRNARKDASGRWLGETVVAEGTLSRTRATLSRLSRRIVPTSYFFPQIMPSIEYGYRLTVEERRLALSLWKVAEPEPPAQVVAEDPPAILTHGCVGVIAHHCAMKLYELTVSPLA
jgi:hypothetical protein